MAFSPQIAPLERFALRDGSKSPMKGEVPHRVFGTIEDRASTLHLPLHSWGGREGAVSISCPQAALSPMIGSAPSRSHTTVSRSMASALVST